MLHTFFTSGGTFGDGFQRNFGTEGAASANQKVPTANETRLQVRAQVQRETNRTVNLQNIKECDAKPWQLGGDYMWEY